MPLRTTLLGLLLLPSLVLADVNNANCRCIWKGSFLKSQSEADLIVAGTVVASQGNAFDIEVESVLRGKEFNPVIRIWGDNGKLCRANANLFPKQSRWVVALQRIDEEDEDSFNPFTPNISSGRTGDYAISACGANWLKLEQGYLTGNLTGTTRWQYQAPKMTPVLLEILSAYIAGIIPEVAVVEAAKPNTEAKKLLDQTRAFIRGEE